MLVLLCDCVTLFCLEGRTQIREAYKIWVSKRDEVCYCMYNIMMKVVSYANAVVELLWSGNECGKNKSNENFKTTIPSKNYDRPNATRKCGILNIWVAC